MKTDVVEGKFIENGHVLMARSAGVLDSVQFAQIFPIFTGL